MKKSNTLLWLIITISLFSPVNSFADPNSYDLDPTYIGAVGADAPLDLYPIAVAVTESGIFSVDLFRRDFVSLGASGQVSRLFGLQDRWPRDLEVDSQGNIYIADLTEDTIRRYDPTGNLTLVIQAGFSNPQAIVVDEAGNIYVADAETDLSVFDTNGDLVWNNKNTVSSDGDLLLPQGIDLDANGNIYVADTHRNQIVIFDPNGNYLRSIGSSGPGWAIKSPVGVAIGSGGAVYVLNRLQRSDQVGEHQVLKFSNDGAFLASWGSKGRGPGELWEPQGIEVAPDGGIWVAGYMGHNVVHYDQQGNLVEEWNYHNIQPGEFAQVRGAVVGKDAKLYVTDFWNQVVHVFDRYGNFDAMWGERGQGDGAFFNFPRFTAVNDAGQIYISDDREVRVFEDDGAFVGRSDWIIFPGGIDVDSDGNVWVTGQGENTLRKYTSSLQHIQTFDGSGIPGGLNNPLGVEQGPNGSLYVADAFNHRILRLDVNGNFEMEFGSRGSAPGKFSSPVGLETDSEGHLFVSETWRKRIQVFSPDGNYLTGWDVPNQPGKVGAVVYELTMDGDYFLYAPDHQMGQAEVHKYALVPRVSTSGRPSYTPGQDLGFYIWSDEMDVWHLHWSSDGVPHTFSGVITSSTPFAGATEIGFDFDDELLQTSATRMDFLAHDTLGEDGIEIHIGNSGVIIFDLEIDGAAQPTQVRVGSGEFSPTTLPLPFATVVSVVSLDQAGKPDYQPAIDLGYYIWQDVDDGEWHIRWSGDSINTYNFSGSITSTGNLTDVRDYSYEGNDSLVIVSESELSFNAAAGAGEDGIDFYVSEGENVTFSLSVNGSADVASVYVGSSGANPPIMPFTLVSVAASDPSTDTQAPTISITGPAEGATVSGTVQVTASASDNQGVSKVDFGVDGVWVGKATSAPYSFNWKTVTYANGVHNIQATAYDLSGNSSRHIISVTTDNAATDSEAPSILITGPAEGATVSGTVQVTASASDNQGVSKVDFGVDGVWVGKATSAPYSFNWKTVTYANGVHNIQATAYDLSGNSSRHIISVTTDNAATDSEAPSILITGPAEGATVSGTVQVTASASDNQGVSKVDFGVDGVWVGKATSAPYSFNWKTVTYANGVHNIQATAYDLSGNSSRHIISVTTDNAATDSEAPSILITGPAEGATVSGTVQVTASASDNQGVSKVDFGVDGVWVGKATSAPYSFNWKTVTYANGVHNIQATAYDLSGNSSRHIISVTTDN